MIQFCFKIPVLSPCNRKHQGRNYSKRFILFQHLYSNLLGHLVCVWPGKLSRSLHFLWHYDFGICHGTRDIITIIIKAVPTLHMKNL